jgi:class 3 adenylate cyclase
MLTPLVSYLAQRPDAPTFLLPNEFGRTVTELFPPALLPQPYKIFPADETQPPTLGFSVLETPLMKELEAKLDRWLAEEIAWQVNRASDAKEKTQLALQSYMGLLIRSAENALMSNLLSDYHAVFWLAHSLDVSRHFCAIPRRVSAFDTQAGRSLGDTLKYRIFQRWATETREQMTQVAARAASMLEGEEQRGLQLFRLLQDDVLIFTEEFLGPDLRELRSFVTGYLRRDFQAFRDSFERIRTTAVDLLQRDRTFRAALPLFGANPDQGITLALLLDSRFETFLFDHPAIQNAVTREEREQFHLISRRVREFAVLNQLRRGLVWMTTLPDGQIVSADRRNATQYSRSTRPMDFARSGVVDPVVHRFGMIYDITAFTETLGNVRRGGGKEEIRSYRQMLVFQRKLDSIAQRHLLQFEKFLGDGAFYTTRRALRLVRAAVEIQRFYSEMKRKGFAFNKGLRIALNYGYYRLLPMNTSADMNERITEFYGPGIVELSRLTTGKANKEIEEIAAFLVSHGYEQTKVQQFFAPLARGVDVIDHTQHAREFYAYLDGNSHLVNEGLVASMPLLQELSNEIGHESQPLLRITTGWGNYIGFAPAIPGVELLGIRLLGMVSLKGLDKTEVGELVPFAAGDAYESRPAEDHDLLMLLRQDFHQQQEQTSTYEGSVDHATTTERMIFSEVVICVKTFSEDLDDEVLIGEWDPRSDDVRRPLRLPRGDFQRLFSLRGEITTDLLSDRKESVLEMYERLSTKAPAPTLALAPYRDGEYDAYVLGEVVEKL